MTRKVKGQKTMKGGRAVQGGRAAAPNLALVMREVYEFWTGAPVADAALREYRALLAVARVAAANAALIESTHENGGQVCSAEWSLVEAVRRLARASRTEGGRP
jgi:hypothetical protein